MSASGNQQLRKTAKHSAIYALGTVFRRVSGLVMLPIYTRYLTPADYGVVELLTLSINILGILVGLRLGQALFRYYLLAESENRKHLVVSTVQLTVLATSGIGTLLLWLVADPLSRFLFGSDAYVYEFNLFVLTLATNAVAAIGMSYLRARQMPVVFVSVGAAVLLFEIVLNLYFVVLLQLHVTGVVYSTVISGIVLAGSLSVYVFAKVGVRFSRRLAAELLGFVAPLILAGFGATYVAFADRYFLRVFGGLHDVGLYALAARLGSVLGTAFEAFNSSWVADRFEIVKQDNAREVYGQFFRFLGAILLLAGAGLAIFAGDFFHIITDPEFYPAAGLVPILVAGIIIRMFVMFCNFGAVYTGRTRIIAESSWARAVVATTGFLLLIPPLGVYGAALALLVANAVEFAWLYRKSTALYDMELEWRPVLLMAAAATAATMVTQPLPAGRADFLAVRVIVYALLVVGVARLPFWRPDERALIREALLSSVRRLRAGR